MITLYDTPAMLVFARKLFSAQNGCLLLMAAPGSVTLHGLLEALVADTPLKSLVLPLLVTAVCLSMYFTVFCLDFVSGVKASRHEAADPRDYFRSARAWSSLWKIATVGVLVIWSGFFSMLSALAGLPYLPGFFMLASGAVAIMATLLDIYSIGENQKRLTGRKGRFFEWMEGLMRVVDEGIMGRLRAFFEKGKE